MIVDDYSIWVIVYPMWQKLDVEEIYLHVETNYERQTGPRSRTARSNTCGEVLLKNLKNHFSALENWNELPAPYCAHHNNLVKSINRIWLSLAGAMFQHKQVDEVTLGRRTIDRHFRK